MSVDSELRALYDPINVDVVWAHAKWQIWRGLYASKARIEILKLAEGFFSVIQPVLFDDVLMALSRLTDGPGSGRRRNLTPDALSVRLGELRRVDAKASFDGHLADARNLCAGVRRFRNQHLAHRDLESALKLDSDEFPVLKADEVTSTLGHIRDLMNIFERAVGLPTFMYDDFIHVNSHTAVLSRLKKSLYYDQHVQSGVIPKEIDDLRLPQ